MASQDVRDDDLLLGTESRALHPVFHAYWRISEDCYPAKDPQYRRAQIDCHAKWGCEAGTPIVYEATRSTFLRA